MTRSAIALILTLLVTGCGEGDARGEDPGAYKRSADAEAAAGRWDAAAAAYGEAFALEDPVPERAAARAWLALRRAWALKRAGRGDDAVAWLRWAERIDPALYPVHLERAMLHDGHIPHLAAPAAALDAYERFLQGWREAGEPEAEAEMAAHARERVAELTGDE